MFNTKTRPPQVLEVALIENGLELTVDGYVRWASTNPRHPRNWHVVRKIYDTTLIFLLEFFTTTVSTSGATAAEDAQGQFGISHTLSVVLYITTYCLAQGVGGIIFPPYSESFGRKKLYVVSTALYGLFCLIPAAVPSLSTIIVGRLMTGFLSAIPSVVIAGSIEDMFNTHDRIWVVFIYTLATNIGIAMGPVTSVYIAVGLGWRWIFYIAAIVTGTLTVLLLTIRESRPSQLLTEHVAKLHEATGDKSLQPLNPDTVPDLRTFARMVLVRPVKLFWTEPIVFTVAIMNGVCVAIIYLFTEALPPIYASLGWSPTHSRLPFIAISLGFLPNILTRLIDRRIAVTHLRNSRPLLPEHKLTGIIIGAPVLAVALWWFAWTIPPRVHVHWIASVLPIFFVGYALNEFSIVLAGYLADSYLTYAASGFAALALVRSILSATFPLFARIMFDSLGQNNAASVLASLATGFCVVPVLFWRYGERLRGRSKFARYSLQVYRENTVEEDGY